MKTILLCALFAAIGLAHAEDKILNIYSSRHYRSDEALYADFTKHTGIKANRIEAKENALIERIRNEGARSPADVLITTDAGRLWRAEQLGLFQPVRSATRPGITLAITGPWQKPAGLSARARLNPPPISSILRAIERGGKGSRAWTRHRNRKSPINAFC